MPSNSSAVSQELRRLDVSSPDFQNQLNGTLSGEGFTERVVGLARNDLVWAVDYLDEILDRLDPSSPVSRKCLHELRSICGAAAILPTSYTGSSHVLTVDPFPFASGGYGDVYKGTLDGSEVAVKRVRVYTRDVAQKAEKAFCKEAVVWKRLAHPNIVPLLSITVSPFQLISDWMPGGNVLEHLEKNPEADKVQLLHDAAEGLCYLHSRSVIHGNLKGANVLVNGAGRARVTDFYLAMATTDIDSELNTSLLRSHAHRWTAPEVLNGGACSKEADVFSFAMVTIEVFNRAVPFGDLSSFMAMLAITQGKRPPRPTHPAFTENLWGLVQRCWDHNPHLRPEVSEVSQGLLTTKIPTWKRLVGRSLSVDERAHVMTSIFFDRDEVNVVVHLDGDDAQTFIDLAYDALDSLAPRTRRECLRPLREICGRQALLPNSLLLPICYDPTEAPHCCGGFADVWKGLYNGQAVAAKALKVHSTNDLSRIKKEFCKEAITWKTLHHPNILPLLGVTMTQNQFALVSGWMEDGNINTFVKAHPDVNRLDLLADAIKGLIYLHDQGVVHGGLKGSKILIGSDHHARISTFSLLPIFSDQQSFLLLSVEGGTTQWMSPELLDPEGFNLEKSRPTRESDCYALGMLIYEVLSGQAPFAPSKVPVLKILRGDRPERPQGERRVLFTDDIWSVLELCWKPQPSERISARSALLSLGGAPSPARPHSPDSSGDADTDSFDQWDATVNDL